MKFFISIITILCLQTALAATVELPLYYGQEFLVGYQNHSLQNTELRNKLFQILSGGHIKNGSAPDTIVASCNTTAVYEDDDFQTFDSKVNCQQHHALGYNGARRQLFGKLHLKKLENNKYAVKDVYCEKDFTDDDFGGEPTFGPGLLPSSGNKINTEHTWPQSRFTGRFDTETQKSDLHHLFPTDSEMNSRRGSLRFGYVAQEVEKLRCPQNKLGRQPDVSGPIFEVPDKQKGNTARAIFYFATRYQMKISPAEEKALKEWSKKDPVDAEEYTRNNEIEQLQGNRNPYIDFPDLLDRIQNFNDSTPN